MATWFKHFNDVRNTAGMKTVARIGGDRAVAAAYRLFEVITEACGAETDYVPVLTIGKPPRDERWLANEILTVDLDGETPFVHTNELEQYLQMFEDAGLIERSLFSVPGWFEKDRTGSIHEDKPLRGQEIKVVGYEKMLDEYTQRRQDKTAKHGR